MNVNFLHQTHKPLIMNEYNETNSTNLQMNESSAIETFRLYYTPILITLGIIGNCLSICVFFKTELKKLSSTYYLAALAISDSLFLLCLFTAWLNVFKVQLFNTQGFCQIIIYLTGVCSFLSVWLVLAFTVERFVAVRYPLHRQSICTVSRAKKIILILSMMAILLFSPTLFFVKIRYAPTTGSAVCTIDLEWHDSANIFNIIDTIITFVIPVIIIVILNTCISKTVRKLENSRRKLVQLDKYSDDRFHKEKLQVGQTNQHKITKMLLIISTVCFCLNLPSYVMRILGYFIEFDLLDDDEIEIIIVVQQCFMELFNTNFGINFIIYCICGQNFRKAVISLLTPRRPAIGFAGNKTQSTDISTPNERKPATSVDQEQELGTMGVNS